MIQENLKANGSLVMKLIGADGKVKEQFEHNLVVNVGLAHIVSRMIDASAPVMTHIAVGAGTTAPSPADTALDQELGRVALTATTQVTTNATNDSVQYICTFNPGVATGAITEAGIFNAASGGTMQSRTVFPVINKGELDTLSITWKITIV